MALKTRLVGLAVRTEREGNSVVVNKETGSLIDIFLSPSPGLTLLGVRWSDCTQSGQTTIIAI